MTFALMMSRNQLPSEPSLFNRISEKFMMGVSIGL